jgi:hypothetical protein
MPSQRFLVYKGHQMKFSRLAFALALLVSLAAVKGKADAVTGSFYVDGSYATPTAGQQMRFYTQTSPLNDCCGGDSVLAWVDLTCSANGVQVFSEIAAANSLVHPGVVDFQNYAYVTLDSATWAGLGYPSASCTAFLFWDGAHNPRRQKNNTLAGPLTFAVNAQ